MNSNVCCEIRVFELPKERTSWGNVNGAPEGHISHDLPLNLTRLKCNAVFKGLKPQCGEPSGFDTKFTVVVTEPPDHNLTEQGKKILFGTTFENVEQNDPHCPKGATTDLKMLDHMKDMVLKAAKYDVEDISSNYSYVKWEVIMDQDKFSAAQLP